MGKLLMLAGGIVAGGTADATVSAYVALSAGRQSRLFRVTGPAPHARVTELDAATTVDARRFQREVEEDLMPALEAARHADAGACVARPDDGWVRSLVQAHLAASEKLEVE